MSNPAFIALLGILAPLFGVFEKVADIFASRAEKISGPSGTVCIRTLQTRRGEQPPSQASLRSDRVLGGALLLFSAYLAWAGYRLALGQSPTGPSLPQRLLGVALICEGVLLAVPGIWNSLRLRQAKEGRPLNSCEAQIELTGTRDQVTRECLHAMIGIGAIRAVGSSVSSDQDRVTIQGGTGSWGAWPQRGRGNQVTICVATIKRGTFRVHVRSESYRAAVFDSYRNSRNIRNIVRLLMYLRTRGSRMPSHFMECVTALVAAAAGAAAGQGVSTLLTRLPSSKQPWPAQSRRRYPVAVLLTMAGFAVMGLRFGPSPILPAFCYLVAIAVMLGFIDVRHRRLPDVLTLPSYPAAIALLGIAAPFIPDGPGLLLRALLGSCAAGTFYLALSFIARTGMGWGDVKLSGVLGLYLGWVGGPAFIAGLLGGFVLAAAEGLALIVTGKATARSQLPFGPCMLAAAIAAILACPIVGS